MNGSIKTTYLFEYFASDHGSAWPHHIVIKHEPLEREIVIGLAVTQRVLLSTLAVLIDDPGLAENDAYVAALGSVFYPQTRTYKMIRVEACWTVCPGTGRHHEVVLLQRVLDWPAYANMLSGGERPTKPGDWMEEGLKYRDRWESKLLRPASWSPCR